MAVRGEVRVEQELGECVGSQLRKKGLTPYEVCISTPMTSARPALLFYLLLKPRHTLCRLTVPNILIRRGVSTTASFVASSRHLSSARIGGVGFSDAVISQKRPLAEEVGMNGNALDVSGGVIFAGASRDSCDAIAPPATFASYLSGYSLSASAAAKRGGRFRVVLGNEAGDADSIVSSLALAYVRNLTRGGDGKEIFPLVSVPRGDMSLRRDTSLLLEMCGIDTGDLVYVDDAAAQALTLSGNQPSVADTIGTELILVDHNRLCLSLSHLSGSVVEILDHHEDERVHENVLGPNRDIAFDSQTKHAEVGSTCTLVTERLFQILGNEGSSEVDASLSLALLSVILLDTMDMSPKAGKGTDRDEYAIEMLLKQTEWNRLEIPKSLRGCDLHNLFDENGIPIRPKLYKYLEGAKTDPEFWKDMSVRDCLRIDYKRFRTTDANGPDFGMSSVILPMRSFLGKFELVESLQQFMGRDGANVPLMAVLTIELVDGVPNREMLLAGRKDLVKDVGDFLLLDESAAFLSIQEVKSDLAGGDSTKQSSAEEVIFRRFQQLNPRGSRKQVAPVLLGIMSTF